MPHLKLARLPDRTSVKLTITVKPELAALLKDYAEIYRRQYGQKEPIEQLVPYMIETFLNADRAFLQARKDLAAATRPSNHED